MPEIIPRDIKVSKRSIAIIGWDEGGAGLVHSWIEKSTKHAVACFVNPTGEVLEIDAARERKKRESQLFSYPRRDSFKDIPMITSERWLDVLKHLSIQKLLIMTPDRRTRHEHIKSARTKGFELINAVHPTAVVMEDAVIHENVVLHACSFAGYKAEIHDGAIINTGVQLDHHCVVYECATIDPGVIAAGNVTIERYAQVHTGAVLINKVRIGEGARVGAGSVVLRDVAPSVTVVGNPARIIKKK